MLHRHRRLMLAAWVAVFAAAIYGFLFHRAALQDALRASTATSVLAGSAVYLLLGCVRGFTLIPSTSLVLAAVAFFPPVRLFALTLIGILVSSTCVYVFAEALGLDALIEQRHPGRVAQLERALERRALPVIVAWSFFPLAPTDLICYACGVLRVPLHLCLTGVLLGEGAICGVYIFAGDSLLRTWHLK